MNLTLPEDLSKAKPFLKWAGGKSQLIPAIEKALPPKFKQTEYTYIEPFAGSGAVLFWMLRTYPNISTAIINDINTDLFNAYHAIKATPETLIFELSELQKEYFSISAEEARREFYLNHRKEFNERNREDIKQTALLIFLNRTCFNGLYRVNSKNQFNVPFGRYKNPRICDEDTIYADSAVLQKVTLLNGDYAETIAHATKYTLFYFDPPYKPISPTSSFNSYSNQVFNDAEQIRLRNFCIRLTKQNYRWLLSNSDPKNVNPGDTFFDELYRGKSMYIDKVMARRSINSKSGKRGEIAELLISNYKKSSG